MAQLKVTSATVFLFIDPAGGTSYKTLVCLIGFKFDRKTNIIDAGSMCGPDKSPGAQDVDITFDGQQMTSPDTGNISNVDLHALWVAKTTIGWKISPAVPNPGSESFHGTGFISGLSSDYAWDKNSTFSGGIGVFGTPVQVITPIS